MNFEVLAALVIAVLAGSALSTHLLERRLREEILKLQKREIDNRYCVKITVDADEALAMIEKVGVAADAAMQSLMDLEEFKVNENRHQS